MGRIVLQQLADKIFIHSIEKADDPPHDAGRRPLLADLVPDRRVEEVFVDGDHCGSLCWSSRIESGEDANVPNG